MKTTYRIITAMLLGSFAMAVNAQTTSGIYENEIIKRQREIWKQRTEGKITLPSMKSAVTESAGEESSTASANSSVTTTRTSSSSKSSSSTTSGRSTASGSVTTTAKNTTTTYGTATSESTASAYNGKMPLAVFFDAARTDINNDQHHNITVIANYLKKHPNAKVTIRGYASPDGKASTNRTLSQKRAQAVKDILVKQYHIAAKRIIIKKGGISNRLFEINESNRAALMSVGR